VKTWLAAALAQPSTARAFETLAGNPKRRSQMGLMLPTARTLRDLYKTEIAAVASGRNFMACLDLGYDAPRHGLRACRLVAIEWPLATPPQSPSRRLHRNRRLHVVMRSDREAGTADACRAFRCD
jgi:hypothetical protein